MVPISSQFGIQYLGLDLGGTGGGWAHPPSWFISQLPSGDGSNTKDKFHIFWNDSQWDFKFNLWDFRSMTTQNPQAKSRNMGHLAKVQIYYGEQNTGSMGQNQNAVTTFKLLYEQLNARAEETSHVRLCSDKTDLYGARLVVQGDSGATTLLRGQEKPGNQSHNKDDFQQGQLCLSKGSAARTKVNDWLGKVGGDQNHYLF